MHRLLPLAAAALLPAVLLVGVPAASARPAGPPHPAGSSPAALMRMHGISPTAAPDRGAHLAAPSTPSTARLDPRTARLHLAGNGTVRVIVTGPASVVAERVRHLGGRVLAAASSQSSVQLPEAALPAVAATAGISSVDAPERPYPVSAPSPGPSQGVTASHADMWQAAGDTGAGTKIAIVDIGFGSSASEYSAELSAGHLGTDPQLINEGCTDQNGASSSYVEPHGLAVAELAHQSAPDAQLYLYCIGDQAGVAAAESAMEAAGIKIASSSLSWFADSRGDGTGPVGSVAATVAKARKAGILWIEAAGNSAAAHWGATMADRDHDHLLDINGPYNAAKHIYEDDFIYAAPAGPGPNGGTVASVVGVFLQWDQWPTTTAPIQLRIYGFQCTTAFTGGGIDGCNARAINPDGNGNPRPISSTHLSGSKPAVEVDNSQFANYSQYDQVWEVIGYSPSTFPAVRYDLNYVGNLDGVSNDDCASVNAQGNCVIAAGAYADSVTAPANSPYAVAVGAAEVGADGAPAGTPEFFSSRGPAIDGRVVPQITGWDGVSSYLPEFSAGFYGTSAAAPNVAGAAALVAGLHPDWDAAQLQNYLEQQANGTRPYDPPSDQLGHGLLTLGVPAASALPAGASYSTTTPTRILDTRTTIGGHHAPLGAGGTVTIPVPQLPADATAVAINLTGVGASGLSFLSAYAGGTAWPGTSNLNLTSTDPTAAVFAIVSVNGNRTITVRNNSGTVNAVVDELGYFGTGSETGRYTPYPSPVRVLDTRTDVGGHLGQLPPGGTVEVQPGLPQGATAAVVNVTVVDTPATASDLTAAPACNHDTSTVNFTKYARANLAIVGLDATQGFCIANHLTSADVVVDVLGYLGPDGSSYVALPSPQRIADTRTGNGAWAGNHSPLPLASNASGSFTGAGVGDVPQAATALLTNVVAVNATKLGYLALFPGTTKPSQVSSTVNFTAGRIVPNAAIVGLSATQFGIYNSSGSTDAVVDLFGYFD